MEIKVNNEVRRIADGATVAQLAVDMSLPAAGVAVAVNDSICPRASWPDTVLRPGDCIVIIRAAFGG